MKIGIVSPYYMHRPGGVQTLILVIRSELLKKGHDVRIIAPTPRSKEDVMNTPEDVIFLGQSAEVKFKAPFHTTHPLAAVFEPKKLEEFFAKHRFDVLNVHEPWMPMLPYQMVQHAPCPVVGTLHARWPRSMLNKSIEKARSPYVRATIRKLDVITASSTVSAQNAYDTDQHAVVKVIPNAVDLRHYQKAVKTYKNKHAGDYILFLNRLEKRKGPMHLLKAYKKYIESYPVNPARLIIAGGGPQEQKLRDYAVKHNLDGVEFEGFVTETRKMELFANAKVYCSPAPYGESFGIVLIEAMAAGVPVVAGDNEGYMTVLTGEGALSLVRPQDTRAFSERLKVMLDNPDVRRAWKRWASKDIKQYDNKKVVAMYEDAYKQAVLN